MKGLLGLVNICGSYFLFTFLDVHEFAYDLYCVCISLLAVLLLS